MNVGNVEGIEELDSFSKLSNYPSYSSSGISTVASLQSYDTGLFADQFGLVFETDPVERSVNAKNSELGFLNRANREDSLKRQFLNNTGLSNEGGIGNQSQNDGKKVDHFADSQVNAGIRVLYRCDESSFPGENVKKEGHGDILGLPTSIRSGGSCTIRVNGRQVCVIPSVKLCKETAPIPAHFKNSDELVNYYTNKVLRSSNSLYYMEKKLQQALYGAVFLAYELNKVELSSSLEFAFPDSNSDPTNNSKEDEQTGFEYDKKNRVALKISSMSLKRRKPTLKEDIEAEVLYSNKMKGHKNVLEYSEIWQDSFKNIYIKMEYAEYEDLFEVMKKRRKPLTENEARWLFSHIFSAVTHLHGNLMAMRDLSLENILMFNREPSFFELSKDMNVHGIIRPEDTIIYPKITDPGQACEIKREKKDILVSNLWKVHVMNPRDSGFQLQKVEFLFGKSFRPPEAYFTGSYYDPTKVDVFCLGWMLLYTLTKYQPFETCRLITDNMSDKKSSEGFINNFFGKIIGTNSNTDSMYINKRYTPKDENWSYIHNGKIHDLFKKIKATRLSPQVLHLIENMLNPNFKERFSMNDVLEHPWLNHSTVHKNPTSFTPIMSSTITVPQKQASHKHRQANNIVKPSLFFEKADNKNPNNKDRKSKCDLKDKNLHSNTNPSSNIGVGSKNTKLVSNSNMAKDQAQKITNERLNFMIKRTNDKLKVTRISSLYSPTLFKKDQDIEIISRLLNKNSINYNSQSESKSNVNTNKIGDNNKHPNESPEQAINYLNKYHVQADKLNKKAFLLPQIKPSGVNSNKSVYIRRKKSEQNFISDLWSFFSGNTNTN
ncbi:hypothetical protein FG386_003708 [Cryptosporidium ryanae]|uniref:uncharacterized protein n=1 Tax=Cryptosporidium ryanae TaxID=515981 RepID=UPI00351A17FC|nr:hypothetical protein FG386_003708 [Cryptosporidium ryanae]